MRVRSLDKDGDWSFGRGRNDYRPDLAALMQSIQTRINSFLNDCFFNTAAGIDWLNLLGAKNQQAIAIPVSTTILNTPGVLRLLDFSLDLDQNRLLTLSWRVDTVYGRNLRGNTILIPALSFLITQSGDVITTQDGGGILL